MSEMAQFPSALVMNLTESSELPLSVVCFLGHFIVFHVGCGLFAWLDERKWFYRMKEMCGDQAHYLDLLPNVVFNQIFLLLPSMYLLERIGWGFQGYDEAQGVFQQTLISYVFSAVFMTVGHDLLFYLGHRFLLHSPGGYRFFRHDLHHSTKASIALSSMYMVPSDYIIEICIPYLVPLCVLRTDAFFNVMAIALGSVGGMYEHSGYNFFPNLPGLSTIAHGMHHARYNCSFSDGVGSSNLMDKAFRTSYQHVYPIWAGKTSMRNDKDKEQ